MLRKHFNFVSAKHSQTLVTIQAKAVLRRNKIYTSAENDLEVVTSKEVLRDMLK